MGHLYCGAANKFSKGSQVFLAFPFFRLAHGWPVLMLTARYIAVMCHSVPLYIMNHQHWRQPYVPSKRHEFQLDSPISALTHTPRERIEWTEVVRQIANKGPASRTFRAFPRNIEQLRAARCFFPSKPLECINPGGEFFSRSVLAFRRMPMDGSNLHCPRTNSLFNVGHLCSSVVWCAMVSSLAVPLDNIASMHERSAVLDVSAVYE